MQELFVITLLLSTLLLGGHLGLRARVVELQRAARTAPELGLRPGFAVFAAHASATLVVLALLPLLGAGIGLADPYSAGMQLMLFGFGLFPIVPLLFAISQLATPRQERTPGQQFGQLALWLLAFGFGMCHALFWLPILAR